MGLVGVGSYINGKNKPGEKEHRQECLCHTNHTNQGFIAHARRQRSRSLTRFAAPASRNRLRGFGMGLVGVGAWIEPREHRAGASGRDLESIEWVHQDATFGPRWVSRNLRYTP